MKLLRRIVLRWLGDPPDPAWRAVRLIRRG